MFNNMALLLEISKIISIYACYYETIYNLKT